MQSRRHFLGQSGMGILAACRWMPAALCDAGVWAGGAGWRAARTGPAQGAQAAACSATRST